MNKNLCNIHYECNVDRNVALDRNVVRKSNETFTVEMSYYKEVR